jgi:asparagine synthase (glutamine-hydrolysing)
MCGICGFTGSEDRQLALRLAGLMAHRGPDHQGAWAGDGLSLGHSRLSILDLSPAGNQPMFYQPDTGMANDAVHTDSIREMPYGIVFNGEIYNYPALREELAVKGYIFTSTCDTELVMAAYDRWGEDCVKLFNGMWAFCIYDRKAGKLFLSRDRTGQKPLYYSTVGNQLLFGSELKVFMESGMRTANRDAMASYRLFGFTPREGTALKGVRKLPPAHNMIWDIHNRSIEKKHPYWERSYSSTLTDPEQAATESINLLGDSVRLRLLADVPVGAFLSGGVDSSAIVQMMRPHVSDLKTFSVGFDHEKYNESRWAGQVAKLLGTDHHEISFTAKDVLALMDKLPGYFDEPMGDSSAIPTYLVSSVAARHVKVVLSGTGGDELFAGYPRHREYLLLKRYNAFPKAVKSLMLLAYRLINKDPDRANKLAHLLHSPPDELYLKLFSHLFRGEQYAQELLDKVKHNFPELNRYGGLQSALAFDSRHYLSEDLHVKEDRATMAHSIEGRMPFMDYRLVELAAKFDPNLLLKGKETKYLLKKALEGRLPQNILYRRKQGFGVPLAEYMRAELKEKFEQVLFGINDGFFDKRELEAGWKKHQIGKSDYSHYLWGAVSYKLWLKHWQISF